MRIKYRVARTAAGRFVVVWYDDNGSRHRSALDSGSKWDAQADAIEFIAALERKRNRASFSVGHIVDAYLAKTKAIGKPIMEFHWKAAREFFGNLTPVQITEDLCRKYAADRGRQVKPGTISKELGLVRAALNWGVKKAQPPMLERAPFVWLPPAPPPRDRRLTRGEFRKLLKASVTPHVRLFLQLAIGTAGRAGALLSLKWSQVDLETRRIDLGGEGRQKKRAATIPINKTLHAALVEAKKAAMTDYVIEYAGRPVASVKRAFALTAERAKLADVTPHVLRHTAATWMAEAGHSMDEIAQYLGHTDPRITFRVYAKFRPEHLTRAADALDMDSEESSP